MSAQPHGRRAAGPGRGPGATVRPRGRDERRRQRTRRRRSALLVVLVIVVLAGGFAVTILDRAARHTATDLVAEQVQRELGLPDPPEVRLDGHYFLWQVLRGRYDGATISAPSLTYEGTTVKRPTVYVFDVAVPLAVVLGRGGDIDVDRGRGSALVPWAPLEERASAAAGGAELALSADGGSVRIDTTVTALGIDVDLQVTAAPALVGDTLRLRPDTLSVAGQELSTERARSLVDRPGLRRLLPLLDGIEVPLDDVPPGVTVTGVRAVTDGVEVDVDLTPTTVTVNE